MTEIERFAATGCELGEGPVWHAGTGRLTLVDIKAQEVIVLAPDGAELRRIRFGSPVGACLPAEGGRSVCFLQSGPVLAHLEACADAPAAAGLTALPDPEADLPGNRYNDAKTGPDGALWFGSMDDAEHSPTGSFYRMSPALEAAALDDGYIVSNGPAFSPCGSIVYHTDTFGRAIYAFDIAADSRVANKRLHIRTPEGAGFPDGMTTDAEGGLWVCMFGGGRILRYDAKGALLRDYALPVPNITSCTFGGENLDELFITTARWTMSAADRAACPQAGDVFWMKTDVQGLPQPVFAPRPA